MNARQVFRVQARTQSVRRAVDGGDDFLLVAERLRDQHRPEDFLLDDGLVVCRADDNGRLDEVALAVG